MGMFIIQNNIPSKTTYTNNIKYYNIAVANVWAWVADGGCSQGLWRHRRMTLEKRGRGRPHSAIPVQYYNIIPTRRYISSARDVTVTRRALGTYLKILYTPRQR